MDDFYYLCILGGDGTRTFNSVTALVADGKYEQFIEWFIDGLEHQYQEKIGETTKNRIKGDLRCLITQLTTLKTNS